MSERSDRSELSTDKDELRGLFLFESLTDDQLDWLLDHGVVQAYDAGAVVYEQSDAAEFFYVLLDGEIQLEKVLDGTDVVLTSSDLPGSYAGATRAFIGASQDEAYASSGRRRRRSSRPSTPATSRTPSPGASRPLVWTARGTWRRCSPRPVSTRRGSTAS